MLECIDTAGLLFVFFIRIGYNSSTSSASLPIHIAFDGAIDIGFILLFNVYKILSRSHNTRLNVNHSSYVRTITHRVRIRFHRIVQSAGPFLRCY